MFRIYYNRLINEKTVTSKVGQGRVGYDEEEEG